LELETAEIQVFGTRGSHCVSAAAFNKYGGLTSCICMKFENFWVVFDAGMGIVDAGKKIVKEGGPKDIFVFLSHYHNDHIEGFNFFAPMYIGHYNVKILGFGVAGESLMERITTSFEPPYFPISINEIKGRIEMLNISEKQVVVFDNKSRKYVIRDVFTDDYVAGDLAVSCWFHPSHPRNGCLVFKISFRGKTVIYATDVELYGCGRDKRIEKLCRDADLVFIDAQYTDEQYFNENFVVQGFGHSHHSAVIALGKNVGIRMLRFFHFDPSLDDTVLDAVDKRLKEINKDWGCAYYGEKIVL
jgi:phosphoribosyl 1,2-cyclic phosphodiesterase